MRTISFKAIITFLLVPTMLVAHDGWKGKYTKEKKINKSYNVSSDAMLEVDNSYGHLYVTTWDENRIEIEVHIKTNGNNEEKVQRKLDEIDVKFQASSGLVSAETTFNKDGKTWWKSWKNNNVNMQINYTIKMPVTGKVDLDNDYGSINLDRLEGRAKISCDYGKLDIGQLMADNNELRFDYTSNSIIDYIKSGKIYADYSSYTVEKAGSLNIVADYTKSKVEEMENLEYRCDYGKIEVGQAQNVSGTGDYLTSRMGTVNGNVEITSDYGSIRIERMSASAGNIEINAEYAGIKIGHDPSYHFTFEVDLEYAGLSDNDDFEYNIKRIDGSDKYYKGYYGSENSGNKVNISSEYGGVNIYKN